MTLKELNIKYSKLFGDLYEYRTYYPEKQMKIMQQALQEEYEEELQEIVEEKMLETAQKRFKREFALANMLPRSHWFFGRRYNAIAKALLIECQMEFDEALQEIYAAIDDRSRIPEQEEEAVEMPAQQGDQEETAAEKPEQQKGRTTSLENDPTASDDEGLPKEEGA